MAVIFICYYRQNIYKYIEKLIDSLPIKAYTIFEVKKVKYLSVSDFAKKWNLSERTIRNYCAKSKIEGVFQTGKTWNIPENAKRPERRNKKNKGHKNLLNILKEEKVGKISGGIYHKIQIEFTYNTNHIEGSQLTHDQTRYIYETNTIGLENESINVDDIIETVNHFRCIDFIIEKATHTLSEKFIKELHRMLKSGTSDSRKDWFHVGDYKKLPNEVGGRETTLPEHVGKEMKKLLEDYHKSSQKTFYDLVEFHVKFEKIHPFQDGNGRVGRLLLFKECLKYNLVPCIIDERLKLYYYRGLQEWDKEQGYLMDTCLTAQDRFWAYLDYFRIPYERED